MCETFGSSALAPCEGAVLTLVEGGATATAVSQRCENRRAVASESPRPRHGISAVSIVLAILLSIVLAIVFGAFELDRERASLSMLDSCGVESVRVMTGDTLWSIADSCKPSGVSTEAVVRWLRSHNELDSSLVYAGQDLVVPVCGSL